MISANHPSNVLSRIRNEFQARREDLGSASLWVLVALLFGWAALFQTNLFVIGLIVGSVLALGAIGLTLIFGILRFANFAHGDMLMLGAYLAFFFLTGTIVGERTDTNIGFGLEDLPGATSSLADLSFGYGFLMSLALAAIVVAGVSVALDRLIYKRLRERDSNIVVFAMTSLGIAFATRAVVLMIWGPDPRNYIPGLFYKHEYLFSVKLKSDEIFIMTAALAMSAAIYFLLYRTKLGKAMRAYSDNSNLAQVSGINTDRIVIWTWIVGGLLMGTAGVLLSLQANLKPELGFQLLLPLFAAAILGGVGKPQGAFIGGLVVGVAQETSGKFGQIWNHTFEPLLEVLTIGTWSPDMGTISAGYKPGIAFLVLIVILLLRPRGLFGSTDS